MTESSSLKRKNTETSSLKKKYKSSNQPTNNQLSSGFYVTCGRGQERKCGLEIIDLLNDYNELGRIDSKEINESEVDECKSHFIFKSWGYITVEHFHRLFIASLVTLHSINE